MKKLSKVLLVFLLSFILAGCGTKEAEGDPRQNSVETVSDDAGSLEAAGSIGEENWVEQSDDGTESAENESGTESEAAAEPEEASELPEDGTYTSKDDVALYLHLYGHLPSNFITKREAEKLGWTGGSLEPYAPGTCIGGSRFGNYEGLLPEKEGRVYTECDIDTLGAGKRGAKRIVFSNDGLIYYTEDHYQTFELLYGDE